MTAFLRIFFLIPAGYILAVVAGTLVLLHGSARGVPLDEAERIVFSFAGAVIVGGFAALPMLVAIVLAEVWRWRSVVVWVLIGGGIGLAGWMFPGPPLDAGRLDGYVAVYLAAGFAGGFVYWLVAGRRAGAGFGGGRSAAEKAAPGAAG